MPGGKANFRRQMLKEVTEATKRGDSIKWEEFGDETAHQTWMSNQFNKFKKLNTLSIGGQDPGQGPDVLKYLKQHDPQNSSGPVKKALDIMIAADKAAKSDKLMDFIKPVKSVLGGGLFSALQSAAASSKAAEKMQEMKEEEEVVVKDMLQDLIHAALDCAGGQAALEAADALNASETEKINQALDNNKTYESEAMPPEFIECVNKLIPGYYQIQQGTAGVA